MEVLRREFDGLTVRGVFDPDVISTALARFEESVDDRQQFIFGSMLGMPVSQIGDVSTDRAPFFADTVKCRALYRDAFGFDPHERLVQQISPLFDGTELVAPTENGHGYNPGNMRWWEAGKGGLPAHAGNEFIGLVGDGAMSHLLTTTRVADHWSYFVVLQRAEIGGALSVYDLLHDDYAQHDTSWADAGRDDSFFDTVNHIKVDAGPGDLVLFGGGWRWHRVDPVEGSRPRITYGGFAAPSVAGDAIHFWC